MPPRCSRTRASRPTHIHHENAQIRPSAFFAPRARLDIYRFNLPWPCLIMESSFRPATAARPHRLSRRFCVYTWREGEVPRIVYGIRASTLHTFRGTGIIQLFLNQERSSRAIFKGEREYRAFIFGRRQASLLRESLNKKKKIKRKKEEIDRIFKNYWVEDRWIMIDVRKRDCCYCYR